jgi:hypothetical protein
MMIINIVRKHQKLLGVRPIYELEVLLGYQRIMDPKSIQTLERKKCPKKKIFVKMKYQGAS